jgi:hypothetical protein
MRVRYLLCLILAIELMFAGTFIDAQLASAASPKVKCTKVGQMSAVGGSKFVCQKLNGKLSWVLSPKLIESPVAKIDLIQQRVNLALSSLLPKTTLNSVDDSLIGTIIAEPGLPAEDITQTRRILKQIYLAQPIFQLSNPPIAILAKSEDFIKSQFHRYCDDPITWYPNKSTTMENWQSWAFVGCLHSTPVQVVPLPPTGVPIDHIESALGSDLGYLPIGLNDNTGKLPTWFVRGLKGVIGEYAMSIGDTSWHVPYTGVENCLSAKLSDISYSYVEVNKNRCEVLGLAASRYMVSLKGLVPTIAFINQLQLAGVWSEQIFSDFLGMPFAQFETEVKDYAKGLPKN